VNRNNGKRTTPDDDKQDSRSDLERRRIGQIVHDDRGSASVQWHDAPLDHERQKFEIENTRGSGRGDTKLRGGLQLEVRNDDTFNPYDRGADTFSGRPGMPNGPQGGQGSPGGKGGKRDLKKLSEWLKLMRAMEERKKNGEVDETE
jgi:hypothetical protein